MIGDRVRDRIAELEANLAGWREPGGYLVPTEPDADERCLVRARLEAAIAEGRRFLEDLDAAAGGACPERAGGGVHCWHRDTYQHAIPNHEDQACCWCPRRRCTTLAQAPVPGHGPNLKVYRSAPP